MMRRLKDDPDWACISNPRVIEKLEGKITNLQNIGKSDPVQEYLEQDLQHLKTHKDAALFLVELDQLPEKLDSAVQGLKDMLNALTQSRASMQSVWK